MNPEATAIPEQVVRRGEYRISADRSAVDIAATHAYLSQSYWARGIPLATVARSIENSLCFSLHDGRHNQVGFARVVTDYATFAYLCDVYVLPEHGGHGLGKWLMQTLMDWPSLHGLRRFLLATRDAHGLYAQYGFTPLGAPERLMEVLQPDIYTRPATAG